MSDILNEEKADKEVIKYLLRYIRKLEGKGIMSKILFDENGDLYRATSFERLTQDDLERELAEANDRVKQVKEAIDFSNKLQEPVVETPVEPAPESPMVAAAAEAVQTEAPVVPEVTDSTAVDPAVAPAPAPAPAPIVLS